MQENQKRFFGTQCVATHTDAHVVRAAVKVNGKPLSNQCISAIAQ